LLKAETGFARTKITQRRSRLLAFLRSVGAQALRGGLAKNRPFVYACPRTPHPRAPEKRPLHVDDKEKRAVEKNNWEKFLLIRWFFVPLQPIFKK